jgi:hypothetical protein
MYLARRNGSGTNLSTKEIELKQKVEIRLIASCGFHKHAFTLMKHFPA